MNNSTLSFLFFTVVFSAFLQEIRGIVTTTDYLTLIEKELDTLDENSLVLDIDDTLIIPQDPIKHPNNVHLRKQLWNKILGDYDHSKTEKYEN